MSGHMCGMQGFNPEMGDSCPPCDAGYLEQVKVKWRPMSKRRLWEPKPEAMREFYAGDGERVRIESAFGGRWVTLRPTPYCTVHDAEVISESGECWYKLYVTHHLPCVVDIAKLYEIVEATDGK